MTFRTDARRALERALHELAANDDHRVRYAALELRLAMEALTYERAKSYGEELSPADLRKWQPRKLMQVLLEIDPYADQSSKLSFGEEGQNGEPPQQMTYLGEEIVLSLADISKHYDALGSFVHMPTIQDLATDTTATQSMSKARARCEELSQKIQKVLNSPIHNVHFVLMAKLDCYRCGSPVRKRMQGRTEPVIAKCISCGAQYKVENVPSGQAGWTPLQRELECPNSDCRAKFYLWEDQIKAGTCWKCEHCGKPYIINLAVMDDPLQQAETVPTETSNEEPNTQQEER